jgi:hypothetical protein
MLARPSAWATQKPATAFILVEFWEKDIGQERNRENKEMRFFRERGWLVMVPVFLSLIPQTTQQGPTVIPPTGHDVSPPLRDLKAQRSEPPSSAVKIEVISFPDLRYRLMERFGPAFFCDPDSYPVARSDREQAIRNFPDIVKDTPAFRAMAKHLGLDKATEFSDDQKVLLYREYKGLRAIRLETQEDNVRFEVRVPKDSGKPARINGLRITGLVDSHGAITISDRVPEVLTCPVCLAIGTRIDTPSGQIAVEELRPDMLAWTLNAHGKRIAMPILDVNSVRAPAGHLMTHVSLSDGRELWVSPGHPTADGRLVNQLVSGGAYGGAVIQSTRLERYTGERTFDLLVAGDTGFYWANGILLTSTLRQPSSPQLPLH